MLPQLSRPWLIPTTVFCRPPPPSLALYPHSHLLVHGVVECAEDEARAVRVRHEHELRRPRRRVHPYCPHTRPGICPHTEKVAGVGEA